MSHSVTTTTASPLVLVGGNGLSEFREQTLLAQISELAPELKVSRAEFLHVYFVKSREEKIPQEVLTKVQELLGATSSADSLAGGFYVTPRKGTISPWSSKATDILRNCGIEAVERVECGVYVRLYAGTSVLSLTEAASVSDLLLDRMTEGAYEDVSDIFVSLPPAEGKEFDVHAQGREALVAANFEYGLALNDDEIDYLFDYYKSADRNPTETELVMFGQVNSEHCRHKIFNADWKIDGESKDQSLFGMIRTTHQKNPAGTLIAYSDNSGCIEGFEGEWFEKKSAEGGLYSYTPCQVDTIMKVETHNHPTAIAPDPGAATGVGGEIRDEGATGIGSRSKAGLSAFMVSNLNLPQSPQPWESPEKQHPERIATPLQIMTEGPIGGAAFGNEFGRPQLTGLFKTLQVEHQGTTRGYHKPIMTAGGMGMIKRGHIEKKKIPEGAKIIQLGGPAMKIGVGGGAASSMDTGTNEAELDFNSVQRANPEMQRRCQEVIDACIALGDHNPILSIHDIGAGGLSNACPELVEDTGGHFHLRNVNNEELSMSPMEVWCNESQERYMLAVLPEDLERFSALCERERCPFAVLGEALSGDRLILEDSIFENRPIDMPMDVLLGNPPKMLREVSRVRVEEKDFTPELPLDEAVKRVLQLPTVARKNFLITIADRTVTGLVARDQLVGPYQVPVADVAVTLTDYKRLSGEAMAMGERTTVALVNPEASGRLAIAEALTNLAAADVASLSSVRLSANWMAACGEEGEDAALWDTVEAVAMDLCPALGISIPVGKDSLSMKTVWESNGKQEKVVAPLSLLVSAFAPVNDASKTLTPTLKPSVGSALYLYDLSKGANRLGGSCLAQVVNQVGGNHPDLDSAEVLKSFFSCVATLRGEGIVKAYHDRSDGGLIVSLIEMAFAGRQGLQVQLDAFVKGDDSASVQAALFAEEPGAVVQVEVADEAAFLSCVASHGLSDYVVKVATVSGDKSVEVMNGSKELLSLSLKQLNEWWSSTSFAIQSQRDNPACAAEELESYLDENDPGLQVMLTYNPDEAPTYVGAAKPKVAVLREQGVNGHNEMAAAFDRAGFEAYDVHMTDLLSGKVSLETFQALVACGGFSYGDVLGAGVGWATTILHNDSMRDQFARFFERGDTVSLGVCNGCQMMSQLKSIIPGASLWPRFVKNRSEQFEARLATVEVMDSPSIFLKGMSGSRIPIPVAHGEGLVSYADEAHHSGAIEKSLLALRYVDNLGAPTERYPFNPNGSIEGITGFTSEDGRATIMMPHPERAFRAIQLSYAPEGLFSEQGPWLRMFQNARAQIG